jgi:chemotaxis methyl-accepting protein methylase
LPKESIVVDVGSGLGGFSLKLSKLFPELDIVLQDMPNVVERAETTFWPIQNPHAISRGKVRFMAHDIFHPNPVKEADVYYVRNVLLDWTDEKVVFILQNLRASMGKNSRLLIS